MHLFVYALSHWLTCRRGATAIEYALIAGGISVGALVAILLVGDSLKTLFGDTATGVTGQMESRVN